MPGNSNTVALAPKERVLPEIVDTRNAGSIELWFICPLCNGRLNNPHLMPACTHRFCGPCLRAWTRASKNTKNNVCPRCREVSHDNWTFDPLVNAFLKAYSENQSRNEESLKGIGQIALPSSTTNGNVDWPLTQRSALVSTDPRAKNVGLRTKRQAILSEPGANQPAKKAKVDQTPQKSSQGPFLPTRAKGIINQPQEEQLMDIIVFPGQKELANKEAQALAAKYPSSWEAGFTHGVLSRPSGYAVVYLYEDMVLNAERNAPKRGSSLDSTVLTCPSLATMAQIKANIAYAIKCDPRKIIVDICNRLKSNEAFRNACRQIGAGKWCLKDSLTVRDLTLLLADVRENLRLEWSRQS